MYRFVVIASLLVGGSTTPVAADGLYFAESIGFGRARGALRRAVGAPLHIRVGVGGRLGPLAIEAWLATELQAERVGAVGGLLGGEPAPRRADLTSYGVEARYIVPLDRLLSFYVRGGPSLVEASGALAGYRGHGLGFGAGLQVSGKVRALGLLWAPLFFLDRGPKITGALYLDEGYDLYWMTKPGGRPIAATVGHFALGFAVGSTF